MKLDVKIGHPKVDVSIPQGGLHVDVKTPRVDTPPYTGDYTVTPSAESQTLETNGLRMTDDVTVEVVPQGSVESTIFSKSITPHIDINNSGLIRVVSSIIQKINVDIIAGYFESFPELSNVITVSNTEQLSTIDGQTITPSEVQQTINAKNKYVLGNFVVEAIPSNYIGSGVPTMGAQSVSQSLISQTLATNGKYMTGDITFPAWDWRGINAEFVSTIYPATTVALKDTGFATWTPSKTASSIKATQSLTAVALDMANYEYIVRWQFVFQAAYSSGATLKNQVYRECNEIWQYAFKRANSVPNIEAENLTANTLATLYSAPLLVYYGNTTGTLTFTHAVSYGFYPTAQSPTWSSSTSNTPNLTIKTPVIYARCSDTYMTTTRAGELDQDNSKYTLKGMLYRVSKQSAIKQMTDSLYDIYNNGIS